MISNDTSFNQTITLGQYPQTASGKLLPIEWIVLHREGPVALLISKYCLICSNYCSVEAMQMDRKNLEWRNSLARRRCNQEFYETAFTNDEKRLIIPARIDASLSDRDCDDKVFLLSEVGALRLFPNKESMKAEPTGYALQCGARLGWSGNEKYTSWWLLPQCDDWMKGAHSFSENGYKHRFIYPKAVFHNGDIQYHSRNVYHSDFTIRPCIMINMEKYGNMIDQSNDSKIACETEQDLGHPTDLLRWFAFYADHKMNGHPGSLSSWFDSTLHKWHMRIQLDDERIWFLSIFADEFGTIEKYSLDEELAEDSHYEFTNEESIRQAVYQVGDEKLSFIDVLIRYVKQNGGYDLLKAISPYITSQFHYY